MAGAINLHRTYFDRIRRAFRVVTFKFDYSTMNGRMTRIPEGINEKRNSETRSFWSPDEGLPSLLFRGNFFSLISLSTSGQYYVMRKSEPSVARVRVWISEHLSTYRIHSYRMTQCAIRVIWAIAVWSKQQTRFADIAGRWTFARLMDSQIPRYVNKSNCDNCVHLWHICQSVCPWLSINEPLSRPIRTLAEGDRCARRSLIKKSDTCAKLKRIHVIWVSRVLVRFH